MAYGVHGKYGEIETKFISGYKVDIKINKCLYRDIIIHENSIFHNNSTNTAVRFKLNKDIQSILNRDFMAKRAQQVEIRRQILKRLIDIVLFIGRQGIPYRGKHEAAHSLTDNSLNHGNFLELVKLVAKYDTILGQHVDKSVTLSKKNKNKKGRGCMVTFLSKHFVNEKLIKSIGAAIQGKIVEEIVECKKFSIMIDSTQDVSTMDQLAICVRYIFNGIVQERLLSLVICKDSSGIALFKLLEDNLKLHGLLLEDIVACSFDGAANMKGIYHGLQAYLKKVNPDIVYTHCMGHVLNLVMSESTNNLQLAEDLFGLIEQSAVFLTDSHKRMTTWMSVTGEKHSAHGKLYRLQKIGATRWWSKEKALSSIMDLQMIEDNDEVENSKFVTLLEFLVAVCKGNFNVQTKYMAKSLITNWSKFETILIANLLLDIYAVTSPISVYLQTKSINYLQAWNMIETLQKKIEKKRNENYINSLYTKCKSFAEKINLFFDEEDLIDIQEDFPIKRIPKKKTLSGEKCSDEVRNITPYSKFKSNVYSVLDTILNSIQSRFVPNEMLLKDLNWLDPKTFSFIDELEQFPKDSLNTICKLANLNKDIIAIELKQFACQYNNFIQNVSENDFHNNKSKFVNIDFDEDEDVEVKPTEQIKCNKCTKCLYCAFILLQELSCQSNLFCNLFILYKFVLLLPSTQTTCERIFSKLKIIKTKLRSSLHQEHLNPLMLMSIEKDIFIDSDKLIDTIANSSNQLKQLLI